MKGYEVAFDNTGSQLLGAYYNGPTTGSPSQLLADINNPAYWTTQKDYTGPTGTGSAGGVSAFTTGAAPTVTAANIHVTGGTGTGSAFKIGDTVTATWNNTSGGDNNSATITSVTVDFSQFGGGTAVSASNSGGTWTATYTITAGSIDDVTGRNVAVTATDSSGSTTTSGAGNFTVDDKAPTVSSIAIAGASPNNATSDTFTVTFSEGVKGVTSGAFTAVTTGGTTDTGISVAQNSASQYTVTVSGVSGSGTLGLNLNNSGTGITDLVGNAISGGGTGQTYTVDTTAPVISSVTLDKPIYKLGDTVTATIHFSGGYDGNGNYTLAAGSTLDGQTLTAGTFNTVNNTLTATFTAISSVTQVTNGTVTDSITVKDAVGNTSAPHTAGIASETIDTIAPAFSTATVNGNQLFLTYTEAGSGLNSTDVPLGSEFTVKDGANTISVNTVTVANKTVTLGLASTVAYGDTVTVGYALNSTAAQEIQDNAGNLAASLSSQAVTNNTPAPIPTVSVNSVSQNDVNSGTTSFTFTVSLSAASAQTVTVNYATSDGSAHSPLDYVSTSGTVTFLPGQTSQTVPVTVNGGTLTAPTETFSVTLSSPTNATIATGTGVGTIMDVPPTVSAADINLSGGSGAGGAFKIGDTVTATWDNSSSGDNDPTVTGVAMDFSQFGGGTAVTATNIGGVWTATYTVTSGVINTTNAHVAVTATDRATVSTTGSGSAVTVDNIQPIVTSGNISVSGASGAGGATFKTGDVVTATWDDTSSGDNNTDTINAGGVTMDFSQFGGSSAVVATNSGGIWTATYTVTSGAINTTNAHVAVTATDYVGNAKTTSGAAVAVDDIAPVVTVPNISVSGGTGTSGAFKIGDTVTATWNNSGAGDNNSETINAGGVTMNFSQFGGGSAVVATNSGGIWTATYTITSGSIDTSTAHVAVTATDAVGNATTRSSSAVTADNEQPVVTSGHIGVSGATGAGGTVFKTGDTVTATWNDSGTGDNNTDTINAGGVTVDFSQFGGGSAVVATNSGGVWTATYTVTAGNIDTTTAYVAVTATDHVGNATTTSSAAISVDDVAPIVTAPNISVSGGTGTGGAFKIGDTVTATWNNSGSGDNNTDTINAGGVTMNFSPFGGGAAVTATNNGGVWTATYTITSGSIDTATAHVAVTATDYVGNATTTSGSAVTVDDISPIITSPNISVSGGTGTGGAFKIGDTVTATWNDSGTGDNNADTINTGGVTMNFSQFGGGAAVGATNNGGVWTATYTITSGSIDTATAHVAVTATDHVGNATTTNGGAVTVDDIYPVVTAGNISVSGGTGTLGAFKIGDTVTATWNDSGTGDNNTDTINAGGVTVDFSQFGGGAAVVATNSGGVWTATYTVTAGNIDTTTAYVAVTAADHVGNATTTSSAAVSVDDVAPIVTAPNINVSGGTGTGGAFKIGDTVTATWNDSASGDNNTDTINAGGVTIDFSQFGGGAAVVATNSGGIWTATYTVTAGSIDTATAHAVVTATDSGGNSTTTTSGAFTADNRQPVVSAPNISVSGGTGTGGAFKIGDTVTAAWNDSGTGDNNTDTINAGGVTIDFSQFGGGAAVVATNSGGVWTATYTVTAGNIATTTAYVAVTAADHVGNATTTSSAAVSVDDVTPIVTAIDIAGASLNNAASETFTVTFSTPVSGVDASDFILTGANTVSSDPLVNADVAPTGGAAAPSATWTVTVENVTGDGALGLDLSLTGEDQPIVDAIGNTLVAGRTGDQSYTIDHTPPVATSIVAANANPSSAASDAFTVTFSEAVTGVDSSDFTAVTTGTVADSGISVTPVSGSVYTVTITGVIGDGTLGLDLNGSGTGIADLATNPIQAGFVGGVYTVETTSGGGGGGGGGSGSAPAISIGVASQTTVSGIPVHPFAGVIVADPNSGATEVLTIALAGGGGELSGTGLTAHPDGSYTLTGTAAAVTSALDALTFTPNKATPGGKLKTAFTLSDVSSDYPTPVTDTTISVSDSEPPRDWSQIGSASSPAGQVYALYESLLGRAPDPFGYEYWLGELEGGMSLATLGQNFIASPEFAAKFGTGLGDAQFLEVVYSTALHRKPDAEGLQYYENALAHGASRGAVAAEIVLSGEAQAIEQAALAPDVFAPDYQVPAFGSFVQNFLSVPGKVYALYEGILGQEPDPLAFEAADAAVAGGESLAGIAEGLIDSSAFTAKYGASLSDAQFLDDMYSTALHRSPDPDGFAYYQELLGHGVSRGEVATEIALSGEAQTALAPALTQGVFAPDASDAEIARLYYGLLGRAPDLTGLESWEEAAARGASIGGIAQAFLASPEYQKTYGGSTDAEFIADLYQDGLGRAPDAQGFSYWTGQLGSGASRASVALGIVESAEASQYLAGDIEVGLKLA